MSILAVTICIGLIVWFVVYRIRRDLGYNIDYKKEIPIGSVWALYPLQKGPWAQNSEPSLVTVIDVKDGWVRYSYNGSTSFNDERMVDRLFYKVYDRYDVPKA